MRYRKKERKKERKKKVPILKQKWKRGKLSQNKKQFFKIFVFCLPYLAILIFIFNLLLWDYFTITFIQTPWSAGIEQLHTWAWSNNKEGVPVGPWEPGSLDAWVPRGLGAWGSGEKFENISKLILFEIVIKKSKLIWSFVSRKCFVTRFLFIHSVFHQILKLICNFNLKKSEKIPQML